VVRDGKTIPALIQAGKTGAVFILDRRNGKPIYGVEERPVPKGDVPGEWYSPTQPFAVKPPQITRESFSRDEIATVTPEQEKYCEDLLDVGGGAHNDGPFTTDWHEEHGDISGAARRRELGRWECGPKSGLFFHQRAE